MVEILRRWEKFDDRAGLRRVPRLTPGMRLGLGLFAAGVVTGDKFKADLGYRSTQYLRRLLRKRLIEVMQLSPAVYRLTELGKIVWRLKR